MLRIGTRSIRQQEIPIDAYARNSRDGRLTPELEHDRSGEPIGCTAQATFVELL